jgi:hypothetical protein
VRVPLQLTVINLTVENLATPIVGSCDGFLACYRVNPVNHIHTDNLAAWRGNNRHATVEVTGATWEYRRVIEPKTINPDLKIVKSLDNKPVVNGNQILTLSLWEQLSTNQSL